MPAQLAGFRVEREDRVGVQVVALPLAAVGIGIGIAGRPEQRVGLRVVRAGQPRRTAALFEIDAALPGVGSGLASRGHGPETPRLLAGVHAIGRKKAADAFVAAGHAGDDEIADDERRHGAAVRRLRVFRQHDFPQQRAVHAADCERCALSVTRNTREPSTATPRLKPIAASPRRPGRARPREAPDLAPGRRVDRRHLIGRGDVHDAVEHERRHLVVEAAHRMDPLQRQVPHIAVVICASALCRFPSSRP